jgi:hypothetical protein
MLHLFTELHYHDPSVCTKTENIMLENIINWNMKLILKKHLNIFK